MKNLLTEFGEVSLELRAAKDGSSAELRLQPPTRSTPRCIIVHLDHWSGEPGTLALPVRGPVKKQLPLTIREMAK